jgi:hypothetical protein
MSAVKTNFQMQSLTCLPVSASQSRVETNITDDPDVENADESVAFSVLVHHKKNPSLKELQLSALQRALEILASQHSLASNTN